MRALNTPIGRVVLVALASLALPSVLSGAPVMGDPDGDGDIDIIDFAGFQTCFFTAGQVAPPGCNDTYNFQPFPGIILADFKLFLCGFSGPDVPVDAVTVAPAPAVTSQVDLALSGMTGGAQFVRVTGGLQTVTVPASGCNWMAFVQLQMNVVNQLYVTGLYGDQEIPGAPVPVTVTHDMQAPTLFIDFPLAGAEITTPSIDVAGRVSDVLSGFQGLNVVIKSVPVSAADPGDGDVGLPTPVIPAQVNIGVGTNGTFFAPALSLELGDNLITAIAWDASGNAADTQITVTRVEIPPGSATVQVVSGNGQMAPVHAAVPQPIVVKVTSMKGAALEGKLVNFHVTRSDGRLDANAPPLMPDTGTMMLQTFTDVNGEAKAYWRLGSDAGSGNNRVEVTSTDIIGTTIFCASANAGAPTQINIGSGNSQRGEAGAPAAKPLDVWVNDACNPIPLVPVTFTVVQGGGKVNGQDFVVVPTGANGHVQVTFTYGPEQGNNVVMADFEGNPHAPARFTLYAVKRDETQPTTLSGIVLTNAELPIEGATATLTFGGGDCSCNPPRPNCVCVVGMSDVNGQFVFPDLPFSGPAKLRVDGATATHIGGSPGRPVPPGSFPSVPYEITIVPNAANTLPSPVLLPQLNPNNTFVYHATPDPSGMNDTELTVEGVYGLKMIITAGSMTDANGLPYADGTLVSLNRVHHDDIPMPMPDGAAPPYAGTLQPSGAHFNPPVKVIYPNMTGLPAGAITNFMSFNHDSNRFEIVATGRITDDGMFTVTDPGVGIPIAGWHCNCPPYSITGECDHDCGDCVCTGADCDQDPPHCDNPPPPPASECEDPPKKEECEKDDTHPVNLFSGEFVHSEVDLRVPGRGFDFIWKRTYRSHVREFGPPNGAAVGRSNLGPNWSHPYSSFLKAIGANILWLYDGTGRIDSYLLQPDGTWTRPEFFQVISQQPDGSLTLTMPNQSKMTFAPLDASSAAGRMTAIIDRNGNIMSFAYDSEGRLSIITDTLGRDITLAYDDHDRITTVTDFIGRPVKYAYYPDASAFFFSDVQLIPRFVPGDLQSVTRPAVIGTPTGNDYPLGKTVTYVYNHPSGNPLIAFYNEQLNHKLTSIIDARGQEYLRNTYQHEEPFGEQFDGILIPCVICQPQFAAHEWAERVKRTRARVITQQWGHVDDVTRMSYGKVPPVPSNGFATRRTTVADRVGNVSTYFYDAGNRLVIKRAHTGRAVAGELVVFPLPIPPLRPDDPPFFETRWEYNDDSMVKKMTHPNGNVTEFVYEIDINPDGPRFSAGNVREIHHKPGTHTPVGDQAEIVEKFEYDDGMGSCCGSNFVTKYTDGRGNVTLHDYDEFGNRIHTTHAIPSIVEDYEYNSFGQMTAHVLPANDTGHRRRDEMTYYASGPQTGYLQDKIVDADELALTTSYEYDPVGNVVRMIDPRGHDTLYTVNALNQVVREQSRAVNGVRYEKDTYYDANNNVVRVDVQNVDENGVIQPNSHFTTVYEYEILNNVVGMCQEKGDYTGAIPGPVNQPTCEGLPAGQFVTTEYEYDAKRNPTLVRNGEAVSGNQPENVVQTLYDERDLVFRTIRGEGSAIQSSTQYDYDNNQNRKVTRAGLEDNPHVTTYAHDAYDRRLAMTDAMGNVTTSHYDANGNQTAMRIDGELIDELGGGGNVRLAEESSVYDAMDRRITANTAFFELADQNPIGDGFRTLTTTYSDNSQVVTRTDDNGHATTRTYDTGDRLATTTDAKNNTVTLAYDANSNVITRTEVDKSDLGTPDETFVTTFAYDNLDRLSQTVDNVANTHQYQYDSRSNRVCHIDARGNRVCMTYDGLSRKLATIREMTDTGDGDGQPIGDITTIQEWDDSSRLVGQTDDKGNTLTSVYDGLNRKTGELYADGTLHTFAYDVHDTQVSRTDANGTVVTSTYDALDRVIGRDVNRAPAVLGTTFEVFKYDGRSRMVHAEDDDSIVTRAHNSLSQILSETQGADGYPDAVVGSTWDAEGNHLSLAYPGGRLVTQTYDELDRKKAISDQDGLIATYDFIGAYRVQQRDYGNNTRSTWTYDGIRRIVGTGHYRDPSGANEPIDVRTYTWDAMHSKTSRIDTLTGQAHSYSYDSINRLINSFRTGGNEPSQAIAYVLDGVGNRTQITGGPDAGAYTLNGGLPDPADLQTNQYTATPFDSRQYDENGNLITADAPPTGPPALKLFSYDYRNQQIEHVDAQSGIATAYLYDALSRRLARTGENPTQFVFTGWREIEERDSAGATQATHSYGRYIDEVLASDRVGERTYLHADDLFSTVALSDSAGTVERRYRYSDFGQPALLDAANQPVPAGPDENVYLFAGVRFDAESDFYASRTRNLEPRTGRFTTRDRIGIWQDRVNFGSALAYAGNGPQSRVDPFGFESPAAAAIARAAGALAGGGAGEAAGGVVVGAGAAEIVVLGVMYHAGYEFADLYLRPYWDNVIQDALTPLLPDDDPTIPDGAPVPDLPPDAPTDSDEEPEPDTEPNFGPWDDDDPGDGPCRSWECFASGDMGNGRSATGHGHATTRDAAREKALKNCGELARGIYGFCPKNPCKINFCRCLN